jgi:uracil-DNA glycosylase family 4
MAGTLRNCHAADTLGDLEAELVRCRHCPRLVAWREQVAAIKRARYADQEYWARPVPGFGDSHAWLLVVGLAPGAHGSNRTGRVFTGDGSGQWLYRTLHRAGLASHPVSTSRDDGLRLHGVYVTAAVRCAPPGNMPTPGEREACRPYLERELDLLSAVRVVVALGGFAYDQVLRVLRDRRHAVPSPKPAFGHGREVSVPPITVLGSYHPSQQNTFTGRLTEPMLDAVWARAIALRHAG